MDGLLQLNENPQAEVENEGTKVRIIIRFTKLFTEAETLEDFCNNENLNTENSRLVANVLNRLNDSH